MSSQNTLFQTEEEQKLEPGARKARQITADKTEVVPIDWLKPHPKNARTHNIPRIQESLMKHGQSRPVVANKRTMEVLAGNGTVEALRQLKVPEVLVSWVDIDEDMAIRFVLAENKTNDPDGNHEKYDLKKLFDLLQEVGDDLAGTGFDAVERADIAEQVSLVTDARGNLITDKKFGGRYGETQDQFDKRTATTPGIHLRELVLLYHDDEHKRVYELFEMLDKKWKMKGGHPSIVLKALELCAGTFKPIESEAVAVSAEVATDPIPTQDLVDDAQVERFGGLPPVDPDDIPF